MLQISHQWPVVQNYFFVDDNKISLKDPDCYDICVANKVINGLHCTIIFHVDNNKISEKDPGVMSDAITKI